MIVEVDGMQHGVDAQAEHDRRRDAAFQKAGFRTLRFWNEDVDRDIDGVVNTILHTLGARSGPGGAAPPGPPGHSPHEGEG